MFSTVVQLNGCVRVALTSPGLDMQYVLTNDEASALSPIWNWGCSTNVDTVRRYNAFDGIQDYEQDACQTLRKINDFMRPIHNKYTTSGSIEEACKFKPGHILSGNLCIKK